MISQPHADDPKECVQAGYRYYLDGDVSGAIASYRRATELKPGDAYAWSALGALHMEVGDNAAAEEALQRAVTIQPDADALSNLGLLECQAGDYPAAVALQRRAVEQDPENFMHWGNLGDALRADPSSSDEEANQAFQQAAMRVQAYLQQHAEDARATAALGTYHAILGEADAARTLVEQSESMDSQPGRVALLNAETLGLLGDLESARQRIEIARVHGIAESLIASNFTFQRLGLLSTAA